MPHFADRPVSQQHFHDIKPQFYARILQEPQIIKCGSAEPLTAFLIYRRRRPDPLLGRAGFYLHKDKAVLLSENQIHFATIRAEVGCQELQALPFEMFLCGRLAQSPVNQMPRKSFNPAPGLYFRHQVHWPGL